MKVKKMLILLFSLLLVLPSLGCNEKQVYTKDEVLDMRKADYTINATFTTFDELKEASDDYVQNSYYYVLNIERYSRNPSCNGLNYAITFSYRSGRNMDGLNEQVIYASDEYVWNRDIPQSLFSSCGRTADGGIPKNMFSYIYVAFATEDNNTPLVYEHALYDSDGRMILIYQNNKMIGIFCYTPPKADNEFYEKLLKDNLVIIGEN